VQGALSKRPRELALGLEEVRFDEGEREGLGVFTLAVDWCVGVLVVLKDSKTRPMVWVQSITS
jgi:hypothetical protein